MLPEELKEVLDKNNNLKEIKDNIYSLIQIIMKNFPNIKYDYLKKNLETLKVKKVGKHLCTDYTYYNGKQNVLYINYSKIDDNDDIKHLMMYELLNITTFNGDFSGFNENNFLNAFNIGFTEILTNNLVGNEGNKSYHDDEVIATNLLSQIIGFETLFEAYFSNNARFVTSNLINAEGVEKWIVKE